MMFKSVMKNAALASGLCIAVLGTPAYAEFPEKPITVVIPFGEGGSHGRNARVISATIAPHLGQEMELKFVPGAAGQKGTMEVFNGTADGYTLLFSHNYADMLRQFVEPVPFDPIEDFVPIARVNFAPISVVVRADSPYQTLGDLIAAAEDGLDEIKLSHSGNWGAVFISAAQLSYSQDVEFELLAFSGGGPAMQALLSSEADVTMAFPSALTKSIEAGEIRVLATAGDKRVFDDVPTFAEAGVEGDVGLMHRVMLAPKGTPSDVVEKLTNAFTVLAGDENYVREMTALKENTDLIVGSDYQALRAEQAVAYEELVEDLTN